MNVENAVTPTQAQMEGFLEPGPEGPIYMLNLLKYKEQAEYTDGRESELSGKQAYEIYSAAVFQLLKEFGGGAIFSAEVSRLMLGEVEELWDDVAIAKYESRATMLEMLSSDKYQEIAVHRDAGLAGQLNLELSGVGPIPL